MGHFLSFFREFRPPWGLFSLALLAIAIQMAFRLSLPISFQYIFDVAIANEDFAALRTIILALLAFWLFQAIMSWVQDWAAVSAGTHLINRLRFQMYDLLGRLTADFANMLDQGEVMSRFTSDLAALEKAVVQSLYIFLFSVLNIILSIVVLFWLDWRLALANFLGMLIGAVIPKGFTKSAYDKQAIRRSSESKVLAEVQETIGTLDVIRTFNLWDFRLSKFREQLTGLRLTAIAAYMSSALVHRIGSQTAGIVQIAIMALGAYLVMAGSLTVGVLVAFVALLQNLVAAVSHLSGAMPAVIEARSAKDRIEKFLRLDLEIEDDPDKDAIPVMKKQLTFNHVSFHYRPGDAAVQDVNFSLEPGRFTAVVGTSGAGKSTVLKLLLRFYAPIDGTIDLDGHNLASYSKASLREQFGVVPQDSVLFNTSIYENLLMGRPGATKEEIQAAAEAADIHQTIMRFPKGYDTQIENQGRQLSGGQRQRLALARALLRNPTILVLDEATSALDPSSEREVMKTLHKLAKTRAVFFVTHRLHTITEADEILVMDAGKIVERGPHQRLLEQDGVYHRLWDKQTGFEIDEDGHSAQVNPERLRKIPLFETLDDTHLAMLTASLGSRYLPANRVLFSRGDHGDAFYIIVDGLVEISPTEEDHTQFRRMLLDTGDFFGELSLLDNQPRSATVRTRLPTLFLTLSAQRFRQLMKNEKVGELIEKTAQARRLHYENIASKVVETI